MIMTTASPHWRTLQAVHRKTTGTSDPPTTTSYLVLGDGDFSYSLDLARCLIGQQQQLWHLTATGWDTHSALCEKYADAKFLLQQLQALNAKDGARPVVQIQHGVNAIVRILDDHHPNNDTTASQAQSSSPPPPADVVIFNHPHIGTEDAARHAQFLSHFFASAVHQWMKPKSILYLTLVPGQWERWQGATAAARHGLHVVHAAQPWVDVPLSHGATRYYQLRRHQTGKSFAARRQGGTSLVYCLTRKDSINKMEQLQRQIPRYPFGFGARESCAKAQSTNTTPTTTTTTSRANNPLPFPCLHCDKSFAQERSLRNHVRCKHDNVDNEKETPSKHPKTTWPCDACDRSFDSRQGLQDHVQAIHAALHVNIRPDWSRREDEDDTTKAATTTCPVCGWTVANLEDHWNVMVPSSSANDRSSSNTVLSSWTCTYCNKPFREQRAQLQHENFCKARPRQQGETC